jgi:hypothetical protein
MVDEKAWRKYKGVNLSKLLGIFERGKRRRAASGTDVSSPRLAPWANGARRPASAERTSQVPGADTGSTRTTAFPIPPSARAPIPAQYFQTPPPRQPEADSATTQTNRKLAWLLAGLVTVAGGLFIGLLHANTPADVPVPSLVTPRPAAEQDESSAQLPSDALSQPLLTTREPTSTPPPPPVKKVVPKLAVRAVRSHVPVKVTTKATTKATDPATDLGSDSTSKNSKKDKSSKKSLTNDN